MSGNTPMSSAADALSRFNPRVAHPARRYDYWLGGSDNFLADRQSGDAVAAAWPGIRTAVIENRRFLCRAVRFLTGQAGIGQFLDIGAGFPTSPNVHEVAQGIAPGARVAYVDNDPVVLAHGRARMISTPDGDITYLDADLRDPDKILNDAELRRVLDFSQPVALMLVAILHFLADADDPHGAVGRLVDALPPGSYLVVSHATYDPLPEQTTQRLRALATDGPIPFHGRTLARITRFFEGLDLLPPGLVSVADWRADDESQPRAADVGCCGAVARKR
jgi:hypothetical protein